MRAYLLFTGDGGLVPGDGDEIRELNVPRAAVSIDVGYKDCLGNYRGWSTAIPIPLTVNRVRDTGGTIGAKQEPKTQDKLLAPMVIKQYIPTGEVRVPREGEWFEERDGSPTFRRIGLKVVQKYTILSMQDIPVPDEADGVFGGFLEKGYSILSGKWETILPLRKPPVMKWKWLYRDEKGEVYMTKGRYPTAQEASVDTLVPEEAFVRAVRESFKEE